MLYELMSDELVVRIPYESEYNRYMSRMTNGEVIAIKEKLNSMIDGAEIHTAGWMPGSDWAGTVFDPIYQKAARRSYSQSALCFGLMVYVVFMERPDEWVSGRFEKDGRDIGSRTYFRRK